MIVKLLTEHHFEFLSLKGGFTGSSESTLDKIPHCWKLHVAAHIVSMNETGICLIRNRSHKQSQWLYMTEPLLK